jgi:thioesterase domain-containing protein
MTDLQKLQNQDEKDKATIAKLVAKSEAIEAVILQDPDNSKAALEAAGIDKQIQAAYKARQRTLQAIEAEQKRLYESEVKAAQDELEKIREKTAAIKEQEFKKAREFYSVFETWLTLTKRFDEINAKYSLKAAGLYELDEGQAGITALKKALDQFTAAQQNIEVQRQFMKAMSAKND